jgi:hypothetical protein
MSAYLATFAHPFFGVSTRQEIVELINLRPARFRSRRGMRIRHADADCLDPGRRDEADHFHLQGVGVADRRVSRLCATCASAPDHVRHNSDDTIVSRQCAGAPSAVSRSPLRGYPSDATAGLTWRSTCLTSSEQSPICKRSAPHDEESK